MTKSEYFKSIDHNLKKLGNIYKVGNKRLGDDTIIFNIQPASMCISKRLNLCQLKNPNSCYAWMDEKRYKNVKEYRLRQRTAWNKFNTDIILNDFIHIKQVRPKIKYIRFNESGDIRNLSDIRRLNYIANKLKPYGVLVYTYTARRDINFNHITLSDNLVINGSGFMVHNNFKVIDGAYGASTPGLLCCGKCIECVYCKIRLNKTIYVPLTTNGNNSNKELT